MSPSTRQILDPWNQQDGEEREEKEEEARPKPRKQQRKEAKKAMRDKRDGAAQKLVRAAPHLNAPNRRAAPAILRRARRAVPR